MVKPEIRHMTFSGIELIVEPLSLAALHQIRQLADQEHPMFDLAPYMEPVPHAADENMKYLDEDNDHYKEKLAKHNVKKGEFITRKTLEICARLVPGQDLKPYKDTIEHHRSILGLNGAHDDTYIVIHHIALAKTEDLTTVINTAKDNYPLREDEITDAVRIFRPDIPEPELLTTTGSSPRTTKRKDQSK